MEKKIIFFFILFTLVFCNTISYANDAPVVHIKDLLDNPTLYNNKSITLVAEVIGEALERGNFSWVNISDDTGAIGLWLTKKDSLIIKSFGSYKSKGDLVKITGIYNESCRQHDGDTDIHVSTILISAPGKTNLLSVSPNKIKIAAFMIFLCIINYFVFKKNT